MYSSAISSANYTPIPESTIRMEIALMAEKIEGQDESRDREGAVVATARLIIRAKDGDTSGRNFESLLASIKLTRDEIFITNTVLCSPRKPSGANDRPSRSEIRNCSAFLRRQIELINPPVVATLGAVALDALKLIEDHDYQLRDVAAKILRWNGRLLVPLYHPSPQVIITVRTLEEQKRDFRSILRAIKAANRTEK